MSHDGPDYNAPTLRTALDELSKSAVRFYVTCECGTRFNPLSPMVLYGNEFWVDGVLSCPDCTLALLNGNREHPDSC